jgi:S-adenosylmethionine:tRNA ribosyltransferase-isomerase
MGSAEMPSAGRAFTPELIARLVARGVQFAPLILHTGVASLEDHEPPYEEYYRVPLETARLVNAARAAHRRVIAVGTTSVRALESVTDEAGTAHPGEGWTRLVITPERGVRAVDALLTGLHEPRASHLAMLEALAGLGHLQLSYGEALRQGYLWHEFGDLHLILP